MTEPLLQVQNLQVTFRTDEGEIRAVDDVSFELHQGETLGIVGESGSGKSVTNLAVLGLVAKPAGRISGGRVLYRGQDLTTMRQRQLARIRGHKIAMIFQDPMTALNPFLTIAEQLTEVTRLHLRFSYKRALRHAIEMLERVGITGAAQRVHDYPHQFSGGMRQRVMIAMALSCNPDVLIADEPTTALDVTIQAQILELLKDLQREGGTSIILITHDLGVVANMSRNVLVMYAGRIVERAGTDALFQSPRHPYTIGLLNSVPRWDDDQGGSLKAIEGQPPHLVDLPPGCSFAPRCPWVMDRCRQERPPLFDAGQHRQFACFADVRLAPQQQGEGRRSVDFSPHAVD